MKPVLLIFILVLSIDLAQCSSLTGPFEAILFYYAYQIDAAAAARAAENGVAYETTIGGDCIGKGCTLEAFIRTIINPKFAKYLTPTAIGASTSPDVYATAEEIDTYWNYNSKKLRLNQIIKEAPYGFANVVDKVVDKVQKARAVVPSADLVDKAVVALKWAQSVRLTEMVILNGELQGAKALAFADDYPWLEQLMLTTQRELDVDRTVSPSLKIVYTDLDYAEMALRLSNGDRTKLMDHYEEFLEFAQTEPSKDDDVYRIHKDIVNVYQRVASSLEAGCF